MSSMAGSSAPGAPVDGGDLDALLAVVPGASSDEELREALVVADRLRARLDGVVAELTGVFDARCVWAADGARSAGSWLAARCDVSRGQANAEVRVARCLRDMPTVEAAATAGRLGREKVKALVWARQEGLEEIFATREEDLVRDVEAMTVARAWRYLRRWVDDARARLGVNEPDGPEPTDGLGGSKVTLAMAMEGRWFGSLDLQGEDGEIIANAIDGLMDTWWREGVFGSADGLSVAERRARALVEVVSRGTRGGVPDGTAKPLVLALIDAATLTGLSAGRSATTSGLGSAGDPVGTGPPLDPHPGGGGRLGAGERLDAREAAVLRLCELSRSGPVPTATIQRLACEGMISPVVIGRDGAPLSMGRKVRLFTRAQRRALRIRDGHCVFAGCEVPAEHCIAHHLTYWEHGGSTDIDNGALVCRFHHRCIHDDGFGLARDDRGRFTTYRPDRSPIDDTKGDIPTTTRRRPPPGPPPPGDDPDTDLLTRATRHRMGTLATEAQTARARPLRSSSAPIGFSRRPCAETRLAGG